LENLKTVSALVKNILEHDHKARNTDNHLYLMVLEHYSGLRGIDIHAMTVPVFLKELGLCAGVIVAVALKQIDCTPDAKTCAQSDNESLKNGYCAIEKCHNIFLLKFEIVLRIEKALRTTGIKTGRKA
jgi:hypothetical protein